MSDADRLIEQSRHETQKQAEESAINAALPSRTVTKVQPNGTREHVEATGNVSPSIAVRVDRSADHFPDEFQSPMLGNLRVLDENATEQRKLRGANEVSDTDVSKNNKTDIMEDVSQKSPILSKQAKNAMNVRKESYDRYSKKRVTQMAEEANSASAGTLMISPDHYFDAPSIKRNERLQPGTVARSLIEKPAMDSTSVLTQAQKNNGSYKSL